MGVGLNTMLAAVGAGGVAASKISSSFGKGGSDKNEQNNTTNPSVDGELAAKMAEKARKNTLANIQNIINQQNISKQARARRIGKELKNLQGGNK
jgi:hypothetical protein